MDFISLIIISMLGEAVWETLKMVWQKGKFNFDRIGALAVGLLLSIATGADILSYVGISSKIPYVGSILTGILISRGANFMHDLLASVSNMHQNTKLCIDSKENVKPKQSIKKI